MEAVEAVEAVVLAVGPPSFRSFFCVVFRVLRTCVYQQISAPRRPDHHRYTSLFSVLSCGIIVFDVRG